MTKIGDKFKLEYDKDGKIRVKRDEAKTLAKLPVNARIARKASKKIRYKGAKG